MKILLVAVNAKYIHSNLAVYSLKATAKEYQDAIEIAEFTINNQLDYILQEIYKRKPDVLMFSCYIWNLSMVEDVMREFHKLCPKIPIWVGGPEVSFEIEDFLCEHPEVSGVMMGEGEETFRELCEYYGNLFRVPLVEYVTDSDFSEKTKVFCEANAISSIGESVLKEDGVSKMDKLTINNSKSIHFQGKFEQELQEKIGLQEIKGIAYRTLTEHGEEIHIHPWREIMNMSTIPFCYDKMEDFSNRIIYYESSRGCPFSCSYCLSSVDKKLRFRDLELVKEELQFFINQKVPQVKFVDRTFNCNHAHAMAIWQYILEHDNGVTNFHFEISADLIREEELELMARMRPGLIQLEIGVQSTHEVTIQEIHRTMKLERLKEVVQKIKSFGNIHQHLDLIAGLPYEDYETFRKSFDEIYELQPNQLQMGFLKVLKGSYMYEHASEYGIIYHEKPPYEVLATNWLLYEDVIKLKQIEEMLEVYYNSGQFEISMKVLQQYFTSAFTIFEKLGDYYERNGLFGMSHSRIKRCEILMDFIKEEGLCLEHHKQEKIERLERTVVDGEVHSEKLHTIDFECIRQALVFDLYYRENCKSRPKWADEQKHLKEITRHYCKNGKLSHIEEFSYDFLGEDYEYQKEPLLVLFSYNKRDPLTNQAYVEYVAPILSNETT